MYIISPHMVKIGHSYVDHVRERGNERSWASKTFFPQFPFCETRNFYCGMYERNAITVHDSSARKYLSSDRVVRTITWWQRKLKQQDRKTCGCRIPDTRIPRVLKFQNTGNQCAALEWRFFHRKGARVWKGVAAVVAGHASTHTDTCKPWWWCRQHRSLHDESLINEIGVSIVSSSTALSPHRENSLPGESEGY